MSNYNDIVVVAGAGISVESGIQPFRGKNGIWEENPMEMATFHKYETDTAGFLSWYYRRFRSCLEASPNHTHNILAKHAVKLVTQNIDGLHRQAGHDPAYLVEIHGCLHEKRKIMADSRNEILETKWADVEEDDLVPSLFRIFNIPESGTINYKESFRPHVLLFDEYYTELYEYSKSLNWVKQAATIIFMGTSNSVGITEGILQMALVAGKEVIVVDPAPAASFARPGVTIYKESASVFCGRYFK